MILDAATVGLGIALAAGLAFAVLSSARENEPRAAGIFVLLLVSAPLPFLLAPIAQDPWRALIEALLLGVAALAALVVLVPTRGKVPRPTGTPDRRIDEREVLFSRWRLEPGTERFDAYYREHPEHRAADDAFRTEPGLLDRGASAFHPHAFAAADASFFTIEQLRPFVEGEPATTRVETAPAVATAFLLHWARKLGAVDAGVTALRDYHLYSVVGRGDDYGTPVDLPHTHAIAVTVAMDKHALDHAPLAPVVMESSQQYVNAGVIAVQLAECIRRLGYRARAHIDGLYRVVCPLVARDAGLGEIGRMGLLMTPRLGPRVRIAVVTTDLPLAPGPSGADPTVLDFCARCSKCADVCPSDAIPRGERETIDGVLRWRIDQAACFTFWSKVGTDCARCVRSCPYSHPDTLLHGAVRWGVRRSAPFRRLAVVADDVFYGRRPPPRPLPDWLPPTRDDAPRRPDAR